jgi:transcriptional regulator with XRE-family HTH domain
VPDPDPLPIFAANLRTLRQRRGVSQEELGHLTGLHFSDVSRIERGVREPGVRIIYRLAKGLGVPPADLVPVMPEEGGDPL